ncbi:Pheromone-binding protein Gp-9 [Anthophora plagiata]
MASIFQGLLSQSFHETHSRHAAVSLANFPECMDRANVTSAELRKIREFPEERIKIINEDEDFRRYGCFLACIFQQNNLMTGSAFNSHKIAEFIDVKHNGDLDAISFVSKSVELCSSIIEETDDECNAALSFKVCVLKAMRHRE